MTPTPGDPDDPIYFTYSNGIDVTPTTSPTDRNVDLDIMGVGFLGMDFDNTGATLANADTAHVYLVRGEYDPTDASNLKANGPVVECRSVLVISDTEIICTINLATKLDPADQTTPMTGPNDEVPLGAYTVTVVNNGDIDVQPSGANEDLTNPFVKTDLTSTSTFTVAPY
ncbi:Hepatocyte growth factor receptor [Actinoplanes friuliensis DSM 7358]|uniref:Hepatocyte growth factor receptor n=1 Tax=Actinoplanes friuliensis DSM 7358 TaxID=1246995 RepID=U5W9S7_9ACTN|nr:Hepatocyte growth factor receptor [Actinoplanes friuliensis DSM 7358]